MTNVSAKSLRKDACRQAVQVVHELFLTDENPCLPLALTSLLLFCSFALLLFCSFARLLFCSFDLPFCADGSSGTARATAMDSVIRPNHLRRHSGTKYTVGGGRRSSTSSTISGVSTDRVTRYGGADARSGDGQGHGYSRGQAQAHEHSSPSASGSRSTTESIAIDIASNSTSPAHSIHGYRNVANEGVDGNLQVVNDDVHAAEGVGPRSYTEGYYDVGESKDGFLLKARSSVKVAKAMPSPERTTESKGGSSDGV